MNPSINDNDILQVSELLGREPRGLAAIPVRNTAGKPMVIQVESLVDNKPFPTLYWLVDKSLNYNIDQLEARGLINELQSIVDQSPERQKAMTADHKAYIEQRASLMSTDIRDKIQTLGFQAVFEKRGIGGIENYHRIRCLHTYYAAHLVIPNTVGHLLDEYWQKQKKET